MSSSGFLSASADVDDLDEGDMDDKDILRTIELQQQRELGALDGRTFSNTVMLEECFGFGFSPAGS